MATPGHVKAAFEHLRHLARSTAKQMQTQKRGPHLEAGKHITAPGEPKTDGGEAAEACSDCEAGVCEAHGTGIGDLQAMHDERHEGHMENRPDADTGAKGEIHDPQGPDIDAMHEETMGHDANQPNKGKKRKLGGHAL